jgi:hypothetical protein
MKVRNGRKSRNRTLPDYSAAFRVNKITPLRFQVRKGANFIHDVQFLSGYLHDARLDTKKIKISHKQLTIVVNRDCWEFGYKEHSNSLELFTVDSQLTITPVSSVSWETGDLEKLKGEVWIESIYLGPTHWEKPDSSELVLTAPHAGWRLRIHVAKQFGDIKLADLQTPRLHAINRR